MQDAFEGSINHMIDYSTVPNCNSGAMVSVCPNSVVDCGYEPQLDQTKHYNIGMSSTSQLSMQY
jgi:hypothetical protein